MKYKIFGGKTGLRVSELILGTGNFGNRLGHGADAAESRKVFDRYLEAGGNFLDTADVYQAGEAEELLGDMIQEHRDNLILASKYSVGQGNLLASGNSRKTMITAVEKSLKRLKTDRLDLYWVHVSDGQTPMEEILRGLDDLSRSGKIIYAGLSNFPAWRVSAATVLADLKNFAPIIGIQVEYNLLERSAERELLPMAEALGLGVAFWSPLAGGTLTGKYRDKNKSDSKSRLESWGGFLVRQESGQRESEILNALDTIAKDTGYRILDVALAWVRQRHDDTSLTSTTIIGPRTLNQLNDNLQSLELTLTTEQLKTLNDVSEIPMGNPHDVIRTTQQTIYGVASGKIELKHSVV